MLNIERLVYVVLSQIEPDVLNVAPDLDIDSIDEFPFMTYSIETGAALDGVQSRPTAWAVQLNLNLFVEGLDEAIDLAGIVYDAVWSWNDVFGSRPGFVEGLGHLTEVDDQSLFSRVSSVVIRGRGITQLAGSFVLQAHSA